MSDENKPTLWPPFVFCDSYMYEGDVQIGHLNEKGNYQFGDGDSYEPDDIPGSHRFVGYREANEAVALWLKSNKRKAKGER